MGVSTMNQVNNGANLSYGVQNSQVTSFSNSDSNINKIMGDNTIVTTDGARPFDIASMFLNNQ